MVPKGTTLNKLLPAGKREGGRKKMEAAGFEQREEVYVVCVCVLQAETEPETGQRGKGLRLGASNLLSHWRKTGGS